MGVPSPPGSSRDQVTPRVYFIQPTSYLLRSDSATRGHSHLIPIPAYFIRGDFRGFFCIGQATGVSLGEFVSFLYTAGSSFPNRPGCMSNVRVSGNPDVLMETSLCANDHPNCYALKNTLDEPESCLYGHPLCLSAECRQLDINQVNL